MKELNLHLRNRKRKKDTSNRNKNSSMVNPSERNRRRLKKETDVLIFAAQKPALRMNWTRKNIDGQEVIEKR